METALSPIARVVQKPPPAHQAVGVRSQLSQAPLDPGGWITP